ncbi:hypothetical protein HDU93_000955 [Gonapodya sp. JEL0774]|nr:hypothetical protein HDU93_000955 [Gonapodya sp. JEL0774]
MKVNFASLSPADIALYRSQFNGQLFCNEEETPGNVAISNGNLEVSIVKGPINPTYNRPQGVGATVTWNRNFTTGRVCVKAKAAKGGGIVSAFFTIAKNLPQGDEIDVEWVGKDMARVQSAYYKGGVADYCNGGYHDIPGGDASATFHEYCIERCSDWFAWYVDGQLRRSVYKEDNCARNYLDADQILVVAEVWDGGDGNPGTAAWAGGPTDWSNNATYTMTVSDFSAQCGCDGFTKPPKVDYETIACENLPGQVDPFTGGPLPDKPPVPVPADGCYLPETHYKNLTCHAVPGYTPPDTAVCAHGTKLYNSGADIAGAQSYMATRTVYSLLPSATGGAGGVSATGTAAGASAVDTAAAAATGASAAGGVKASTTATSSLTGATVAAGSQGSAGSTTKGSGGVKEAVVSTAVFGFLGVIVALIL